MVNPFDYLYYKVYSALSFISGGGNPITHIGATGMLLITNAWTTILLINEEIPDSSFLISGIFIFIVSIIYFYSKESKILAKYSKESEKSRMIGNTAVLLYVIVTIVAFVWVIKR